MKFSFKRVRVAVGRRCSIDHDGMFNRPGSCLLLYWWPYSSPRDSTTALVYKVLVLLWSTCSAESDFMHVSHTRVCKGVLDLLLYSIAKWGMRWMDVYSISKNLFDTRRVCLSPINRHEGIHPAEERHPQGRSCGDSTWGRRHDMRSVAYRESSILSNLFAVGIHCRMLSQSEKFNFQ